MRKQYIDILKGISILSIMLLHFENGIFPDVLNSWIGNFMITAFYFVSGWLYGEKAPESYVDCLKKRWHSLIIPYLWFSLIILIFDVILWLSGWYGLNLVFRDIYKTLVLRGIGTLWFLPALLGGELIFIYFRKGGSEKKICLLVGTFIWLSLYGMWSQKYGHVNQIYRLIDTPLNTVKNILGAWYVIAAGYYLERYAKPPIYSLSSLNKFALAVVLLGWYTLAIIYEVGAAWMGVIPIIGSLGLLIVCMLTEKWSVNRFFSFFGRNSLVVMVTHYSILQVICDMANYHFTGERTMSGMHSFYFLGVAVLLEYPIIFLINKKAKFLIGK